LSCTKLTTSGAVGSTSVISGFQIERFSNNVIRILANDDTALLAYNTNTGICAYQGETQVEFRIDGTALLTCKSAGVRIGDSNTPTEILDVNGNALISGELTAPTNLSVNDYVEVYVTLKKTTGAFGTTMDGCRVRLASDIDFEYLGT
jgi:hypothetical protein